jgi:hypothetical protein
MTQSARWLRATLAGGLAAAVLLLGAGAAEAQRRGGDDREFQLGLGAGLVDPEDSESAEVYLSASLRIPVGGGDPDAGDGQWNGDHYRGRPPHDRSGGGIVGYIEPEVGHWSGGGDNEDIEDLLVGINLVGVVPTRTADYYLGVGFGVHLFDAELRREVGGIDTVITEEDERFGGNLHVGVDVNLGPSVALFGTGRIDILEGDIAERQTKVYAGLRLKF